MKKCKWCNNFCEQFADSHIIPKAFFNYDGKNDRVMIGPNARGIRRPVGSYDRSILCLNCERDFSHIDSEAAEILLNNFENNLIPFNDQRDKEALQIHGKFFQPLKKFLIYVLWRASASELAEFSRIKIGPYEDKIKYDLQKNRLFTSDEYSFWGYRVEKPSATLLPRKLPKSDLLRLNYYSLDLANYTFQVKIDSQKTPYPFDGFANHQNVPFLKFEKTPDNTRKAMARMTQDHFKTFGQIKSLKTNINK